MSAILNPSAPAIRAGRTNKKPLPLEQDSAEADRLLTGKQLASRLGVSLRTVEQWSSSGIIPKLRVGSRFTRYRFHNVQAALDRYETAILKK